MKKFFKKIKDWFKRHKPSKRRLIQLYSALLYNANFQGFKTGNIYTGGTKNFCVPGLNTMMVLPRRGGRVPFGRAAKCACKFGNARALLRVRHYHSVRSVAGQNDLRVFMPRGACARVNV